MSVKAQVSEKERKESVFGNMETRFTSQNDSLRASCPT